MAHHQILGILQDCVPKTDFSLIKECPDGVDTYFCPLSEQLLMFYVGGNDKSLSPLRTAMLTPDQLKFDDLWWFRDKLLQHFGSAETIPSGVKIHYNNLKYLNQDWTDCETDELMLRKTIKSLCQSWYKSF